MDLFLEAKLGKGPTSILKRNADGKRQRRLKLEVRGNISRLKL